MTVAFILGAVLLAGPLSVVFGETRYDDRDRRGWWPGARRHKS
jgi:hypothetical protein